MTTENMTEVEKIMARLTNEDVAAWHAGRLTDNTCALVDEFGPFQVWGLREGSEPLSVIWPA